MPQNRKFATPPKTDEKEESNAVVVNEPSTPDQIGSSIVRRDEPDDED